jgi:hypothetical protein
LTIWEPISFSRRNLVPGMSEYHTLLLISQKWLSFRRGLVQLATACTLEVSCGCVQDNSRMWFLIIVVITRAVFKKHVWKSVRKTVAERRLCYGFCLQNLLVNSLLHLILSCKCNVICSCVAYQILNFKACIQWLLFLLWTHSWGPISKEKEMCLSIRFYNSRRRLPETKRHSSPFLHWSGSRFPRFGVWFFSISFFSNDEGGAGPLHQPSIWRARWFLVKVFSL